jgi:uncharacterized protein involved in exopolysaccharide biosynthesis
VTDSQAKFQPPALVRNTADDEIGLLDCLRVMGRYRWKILGLWVVVMALTVMVTLRKPRPYQLAAMIVPPLDLLQGGPGAAPAGAWPR